MVRLDCVGTAGCIYQEQEFSLSRRKNGNEESKEKTRCLQKQHQTNNSILSALSSSQFFHPSLTRMGRLYPHSCQTNNVAIKNVFNVVIVYRAKIAHLITSKFAMAVSSLSSHAADMKRSKAS
jgi:hypothetical protein